MTESQTALVQTVDDTFTPIYMAPGVPESPEPLDPTILPPTDPVVPPLPGPDIPPLPERDPETPIPVEEPPLDPHRPEDPSKPLIA